MLWYYYCIVIYVVNFITSLHQQKTLYQSSLCVSVNKINRIKLLTVKYVEQPKRNVSTAYNYVILHVMIIRQSLRTSNSPQISKTVLLLGSNGSYAP